MRFSIVGYSLFAVLAVGSAATAQPSTKAVKQALACAQSEGWFSAEVARLPRWRVAAQQIGGQRNPRLELMVYDRPRHGDYLEMEITASGPQRVFQLTNTAVFEIHGQGIVKFPVSPRGGLWAL